MKIIVEMTSEEFQEFMEWKRNKSMYDRDIEQADKDLTLMATGATFATDNNDGRKWISVKDRLPETIPCSAGTAYSEAVNVLTTGRKVLTAIWDGVDFIADAAFWDAEGEEITHWTRVLLPLPQEE